MSAQEIAALEARLAEQEAELALLRQEVAQRQTPSGPPSLVPPFHIFNRVVIIGFGLIGSSLARAIRHQGLAKTLVACDASPEAMLAIEELDLADEGIADPAQAVIGADLVILGTPVSAYTELAKVIAPHLMPGAIVTDLGSVKGNVVRDLSAALPETVHLVPGHPVAGTEKSGPAHGFAALFVQRWAILTPPAGTDHAAVEKIAGLWRSVGSNVVEMDAIHHDMVLAITSHLPHLIAYTIVGTAVGLEDSLKSEVIKFSASGFRDFTRIAASDPTMWRDIFLNNRDAVLEMLQRFNEDLSQLQRAIRHGEGEFLFDRFARARDIRRGVIDAKQA